MKPNIRYIENRIRNISYKKKQEIKQELSVKLVANRIKVLKSGKAKYEVITSYDGSKELRIQWDDDVEKNARYDRVDAEVERLMDEINIGGGDIAEAISKFAEMKF